MNYALKDYAEFAEYDGAKLGLFIRCPNCGTPASFWFRNPIRGVAREKVLWDRQGETLETMSLRPSLRMIGHFHCNVSSGQMQMLDDVVCRQPKSSEPVERGTGMTDELLKEFEEIAKQVHHSDCGEVGETGDHGELGENAEDHPVRKEQVAAAIADTEMHGSESYAEMQARVEGERKAREIPAPPPPPPTPAAAPSEPQAQTNVQSEIVSSLLRAGYPLEEAKQMAEASVKQIAARLAGVAKEAEQAVVKTAKEVVEAAGAAVGAAAENLEVGS